jgi:hypothetical protein
MHNTDRNTEALLVASKETGLEVNAEKPTYTATFRDQHAGQNHNLKIRNKPSERGERLEYLGTHLRNQNSTHEDTNSRKNSGNACYHAANNRLSSSLLPKNTKIKIC